MTEGGIYLAKSENSSAAFGLLLWQQKIMLVKLSMGHRFGLSSLFLGLKEARLNCNHLKSRKASASVIIHMPNVVIKPNVKKSASVIPYTQVSNVQYFWMSPFSDKRCRTLWQYGLGSFNWGYKRFLPKSQHTQRKLLNFENWVNGKVSKSY